LKESRNACVRYEHEEISHIPAKTAILVTAVA